MTSDPFLARFLAGQAHPLTSVRSIDRQATGGQFVPVLTAALRAGGLAFLTGSASDFPAAEFTAATQGRYPAQVFNTEGTVDAADALQVLDLLSALTAQGITTPPVFGLITDHLLDATEMMYLRLLAGDPGIQAILVAHVLTTAATPTGFPVSTNVWPSNFR